MMRLAALAPACLALATVACSSAADFSKPVYDRKSGNTLWRLDESEQGFVVSVRQEVYQFFPDPYGAEETCRREAVALAVAEAYRRTAAPFHLDERLIRSSSGRNGLTGITTCTAQAQVVF